MPAVVGPYPSDLTDTAWARIRALVILVHAHGGRPCCEHRWREYSGALLYVVTTGCSWRAVRLDVTLTWSAAHMHFTRWTRRGLWRRLLTMLRGQDPIADEHHEHPTTAIVDSSSV